MVSRNKSRIGRFLETHLFENHFSVYCMPWSAQKAQNKSASNVPSKWAVGQIESGTVMERFDKKTDAIENGKKSAKSNRPSKIVVRKKNGDLQREIEYHSETKGGVL